MAAGSAAATQLTNEAHLSYSYEALPRPDTVTPFALSADKPTRPVCAFPAGPSHTNITSARILQKSSQSFFITEEKRRCGIDEED